MSNRTLLWIVGVLIIIAGAVYSIGTNFTRSVPPQVPAQQQGQQIANPASVNCTETLGGTLEIADTAQGQVGFCHLKDGRVCEEWALFRDGSCVAPQ